MRMRACACDGRVSVHAMTWSFFLIRLSSGCIPGGRSRTVGTVARNLVLLARKNLTLHLESILGEPRRAASARHALHGSRRATSCNFSRGREREEVLLNGKRVRVTRGAGSFGRFAKMKFVGNDKWQPLALYFSQQEVYQLFFKSDHLFLSHSKIMSRDRCISLLPSSLRRADREVSGNIIRFPGIEASCDISDSSMLIFEIELSSNFLSFIQIHVPSLYTCRRPLVQHRSACVVPVSDSWRKCNKSA